MNEVDEKALARQQRRTREEDEERLAEQLRHADNLDAIKRGQVLASVSYFFAHLS